MIGIFVAAEVRIYREGLVAALRRHAGIDVVAAGRSLEEMRASAIPCSRKPDWSTRPSCKRLRKRWSTGPHGRSAPKVS